MPQLEISGYRNSTGFTYILKSDSSSSSNVLVSTCSVSLITGSNWGSCSSSYELQGTSALILGRWEWRTMSLCIDCSKQSPDRILRCESTHTGRKGISSISHGIVSVIREVRDEIAGRDESEI